MGSGVVHSREAPGGAATTNPEAAIAQDEDSDDGYSDDDYDEESFDEEKL